MARFYVRHIPGRTRAQGAFITTSDRWEVVDSHTGGTVYVASGSAAEAEAARNAWEKRYEGPIVGDSSDF